MPYPSTRTSLLLCLCVGLLASAPAQSHQTVSTGWCTVNNPRVEIIGSFSFTAGDLSTYSNGRIAMDLLTWQPCYDTNGCGIVDQWHWASQRAAAYCKSLVPVAQQGTLQPIPMIDGPTTYFGDKHHKYRYTDGLNGVCAACNSGSEAGN